MKDTIKTAIPADSLYHQNKAQPDTWVFTDGLGRRSLTNAEVGDPRDDRTLAMFYWTWHTKETAAKGAVNVNELMKQYPDAKNDYNHKAWEGTGHYCFWNEPVLGFYNTEDPFVLRRHSEMLAAAGVDAIFADNTNGGMTWKESYLALYECWDKAREDGVNVPKVSYHLPFAPFPESDAQVRELYREIYGKERYKHLWFKWEGKPMLMAHSHNLAQRKTEEDSALYDYFTWRQGQPGYLVAGTMPGQWGWLSTYPQAVYTKDGIICNEENLSKLKPGEAEQMTVGVSVNHNYETHEITAMNGEHVMGRSYTPEYPDRYAKEGSEATLHGYQFSKQFDYALKIDPRVIFITGWNEWHAWRQPVPWGDVHSMVANAMADQFDNEHSRDLEPTRGELKDHYYYLLVNYARKYKGCSPIPAASAKKTIDLEGGAAQWADVKPYFASYAGNVLHRDDTGYGDHVYREDSGRNDLIGAQVARDEEYLYFRVECAENITAPADALWMNLYLDLNKGRSGWEGFDYTVRYDGEGMSLCRFTGNGFESEKVADCAFALDGRYLTVKIKKSDLGVSGDGFTVDFAWTDNVHDLDDNTHFTGDILQFYATGDVAPGGRFRYSYKA